ncbi:DNA methyltransferase [Pseudoxanthomonas sangjuensis]|uniref:endonuclease domain-containing protein n=1 Tax=Pseudoxanthomonas sangjuensis TaxID=1503750 RepID=UPI001391BA46|nr:endonuclease domain-containing protein [Pseudoxanthomonas sangjuensis]KAF1713249.1 DNA methyltransferase [Pseudoxanthomonas sangjuensis]
MREGQKTKLARHLRRAMTDAERSLWHHLRNRAFMAHKFRRQHPVGPYIADFVCLERRLIVELDGGQHAGDPRDETRDRVLQAAGYRVLRFWDNDALASQQVVLAVIFDALNDPSSASAGQDTIRQPT